MSFAAYGATVRSCLQSFDHSPSILRRVNNGFVGRAHGLFFSWFDSLGWGFVFTFLSWSIQSFIFSAPWVKWRCAGRTELGGGFGGHGRSHGLHQ